LELKRNRRRGQGEQFITENAKRKNGNATNFSFSLDLFGRFRFGRSCRKTNFKNQKEIST